MGTGPDGAGRPRPARFPILLLVLAASACERGPRPVSLAALRADPAQHAGEEVIVSGTLRAFPAPEHYWIENAELDRVGLEGGGDLRPLVGWTVEVSGTFLHDREAGRRIRVTRIRSTH